MPVLPPSPPITPPGLGVTAQQLINSSLRLINVLPTGETPTAAESQDALATLNQMVDAWQGDCLMIFSIIRQVFSLSGGTYDPSYGQKYAMGPGGDFNTARPAKIDRLSVINLNNAAQPLELPLDYITDAQWQGLPVKAISSSLPQLVYDDQQFPSRNLYYWPVPNQFPCDTAIYSWSAISQFTDLGSTSYTFPPGYQRAIRYNLAVDLSPEFQVQIPPLVLQIAAQSKADVAAMNAPLVDLKCDPALVGTSRDLYNWITDAPVRR
jgi:hypothetical protein